MSIRYGFLSTHPPTMCGLATFNSALAAHLTTDTPGGVVRVTAGGDDPRATPGVVHTWSASTPAGWRDAAAALDTFDVAVVQHEYGIYPGADGDDVLPLLRALTVPSIVVLHTVLSHPSARQKALLEQIVGAADAVVTMTVAAHDRLLIGYDVRPAKVCVIPHGAADHTGVSTRRHSQPHLLTWGLLGPGKGIEWAIRGLATLQDLRPAPVYTVAGRTHPKVLEQQGETYRTSLGDLGADLGVAHAVRYEAAYLDDVALGELIRSADIVVLPYDSTEQVTSGVLIEAVAARIPVVATAFPHAVELLTDGPGLVVPHQDPEALADAVRSILTRPGLAARMRDRSPAATTVHWPAVAQRYHALAARLVSANVRTGIASRA